MLVAKLAEQLQKRVGADEAILEIVAVPSVQTESEKMALASKIAGIPPVTQVGCCLL